uniref:Vacuolar protein sorting 13 homolog C n=1 Tax=Oryzias melastigma TaxID=30732 RepID=A0A3B3DS88_ORYME
MVFEALLSDTLNRFIGDYVENLDKSQLKIGIWGNVVLENLKVKENALSEFDIPFKVKAGQIKLTLKIPWKNLYNEAVVASMDGLYLLVVPGAVKYDASKEERYQQEAKHKELQRIEEVLQMAASRNPKAEKKDTFVEKLATQVIKNLQVKISSIHLRYEDDLSDPQRPLSIGVTLSELSLQTTDENWKSCILNEAAKIIYKLGRLECLCAYWNVKSPMFYKGSWEDILQDKLKGGISTKEQELPHYQYFRPVFAFAKICINPNAELELSSPKVNLHLEVQNIALEMTKPQYLNMVELLESIDRMVKNAPYRMFRPEVPVLKNARTWKYSINSIMEVHIRRVSRMWAWSSIHGHRRNLKAYKTAYKTKLLAQSKTGPDTERQIQDLEKVLDVFNITLARQQAQMEVIRSGQKLAAKKAAGQKQGGGFFSGWFGRKTKKEDQELETPEEKEKLYTAIGYSGSSHNLSLPRQYVAVVVTFQLLRTSLILREQHGIPEIIKVQMINLSTKVSQRPGAQAFVEMALEHWYVTGLQQHGEVPSLIASVGDSSSSLLSVVFELNPEESTGDQLLRVHSQPVEIIYDALTVNSMVDFFKTEKGVDLEVLTSATLSKLEEIKEKTAALSHIIETRKVLDLMIDLKPSYLLLPKSGFYSATADLVVVDFGNFQLHSVEQRTPPSSSASFSSLEDIMDRAYDRYKVQLRRVQVLYSKSVAWKSARLQSSSVQHILHPMDISLQLDKCMVEKDVRMPFKVSGELPLLHVRISDQKILSVVELINSIPLPHTTSSAVQPAGKSDGDVSERSTDEDHQSSTLEELTTVSFKFEVGEVLVELSRQMDQEKVILSFSVSQLGAAGKMRPFDLSVTSYLRRVQLDFCLHLISSSELQGSNLLKVEFTKVLQADPSGPSFQSLFSSTEQMLKQVEFSSLDFLLHTKALLSTINYLNQVVPPGLRTPRDQEAAEQLARRVKDSSVFSFKLFAVLGCFHVEVCDDCRSIADIRVQIDASVFVQAAQTQVFTRLQDIVVTDSDPTSIHRKVVSLVSEEVFSFRLSLYPGAVEGEGYRDMSKVDGRVSMRLGCIQIVYLHKFLMSLLFVDNFQTAKEALSAATAQAAEKAASSVRDFAQKSFRLSMDIQLKAPLIIIPQSSKSQNAMVVDLGLITVANAFTLLPDQGLPVPAVVEKMDVQLTQLKLCLQVHLGEEDLSVLMKILVENIGEGNHANAVNVLLEFGIKEVVLTLKRLKMQEDVPFLVFQLAQLGINTSVHKHDMCATAFIHKVSLKCLEFPSSGEPLCLISSSAESGAELLKVQYCKVTFTSLDVRLHTEALLSSISFLSTALALGTTSSSEKDNAQKAEDKAPSAKSSQVVNLEVGMSLGAFNIRVCDQTCTMADIKIRSEEEEALGTVKFSLSIESLGLILYSNDPEQPLEQQHQQERRLGELTLHLLRVSGNIQSNRNLEVSIILTNCTLDDLRAGMERVTTMVRRRQEDISEPMIDVTYRQAPAEKELVLILQKLYLCASVEFLMAVTDFFLQALPQTSSSASPNRQPVKQTTEQKVETKTASAARTRVQVVILDPEVVFVASLMKADTPALVVSFQSDFSLQVEDNTQSVRASLSGLKVLACPFIPNQQDKAITTVLRPCSVIMETKTHPNGPLLGSVRVEEIIIKQISPVILNTVMTITAAMTAKPRVAQGQDLKPAVTDLWAARNIYNCDFWFLGVEHATEMTESFRELDASKDGESFTAHVKVQRGAQLGMDKSPVHGDDFTIVPEPRTFISICSKDTMNITISKCSISVFQNLAKAFSEGTSSTFDFTMKEKASFTIKNALGIPLIVQHGANLRAMGSSVQGKLHELPVDQSMDLEHTRIQMSSRGKLSALQRQESSLFSLTIPSGYSEISNISLDKPGRRLCNIRGPMLQEAVSVLLQIQAADGNKVMTVRAPLQNHFSVPFTILKYCQTSRSLQSIGLVKPEEDFDVTLECQLFVCPAGLLEGQYNPSTTCVAWKEQVHHSTEVHSLLQCPANSNGVLPLMVSTLATPDDLQHIANHGEEDWDPAYVIHLHPVATLRNLLPYMVCYMMEQNSADSYNLPEGSISDLLNARLSGELVSLALVKYQGRDWHGHFRIQQEMPEFFDVCLTCESTTDVTVDVSLHVRRTANRLVLSLFSPYWIINKTSRVLQYRAENITVKHPADYRDVILFSFRRKKLFTENQVQLCISTSSWSEGFSLDTVGSYGCVRCPSTNMDFLIGVSIQMSSFNLTRIVTMSPYYTLVNKSSYELEVGEVVNANSTKWHYISSTECLPLWPETASGKLCVRVVGSESSSECFFFHREDRGTLLKLDVQCGGIILSVNSSNHSTVISFSEYYEGAAPALLVNHTAWVTIIYSQKPSEACRFVWDDPTRPRMLRWSYMEHSGELNLLKDEMGQFFYDNKSQVHWISFLDGRQRVLLFTEDTAVVTKARQAEELEQFQQEVRLSLQSLGLSLVNNSSRHEIAYIGINSGVVWEMKPKNRWKPFCQKNIDLLEKAYQSRLSSTEEGGWTKLETNVNFSRSSMMMRKPYSCPIRRTFQPGIYMELKQSLHQRSLRAQLYWLQVDNQLPGAIFPIVFHPVPPPKSLVQDSPKPFFDVSVITRFNQHSKVMQFYFMALVQEMAVKLDQGFLGATLALFTPAVDSQAERQKSGLIETDLQGLQAELMEASLSGTSGLNFFEYFHISPIKLHLSLSLDSSSNSLAQETAALQSLNLLLKSIGATLTDVDDVVFLAFFEVKYQFYRREELIKEAAGHYGEQFLKQMYVLVLGLDVLGNPFGLIRGLSEGVEAFFYEPFQGAVQGPEEFAEGFAIGVRSLLGHTVGAAGMVSKITGSMGKGLAAITMDKEFQQKRREEMNRQPKDFSDSLAKGGKGLLKGVVGGVTGIVTKPVEAKKDGAAGFFKGIGQGLVGIVARPTGGLVDMASSTFQGIQRAAEATEEVTRLRPPRLIKEDGIIRPYDLTESQGFDLFQRSQIKLLDGELFREHCRYPGHSRTNIIVTNRVLCVKESDFMSQFIKEWEYLFENFYRPPAAIGSELKIYYKKLVAAICDAQVDQLQQRMVRQKSQRFL